MQSRPVIQEKAVIAQYTKDNPIGEALRADNPASKPMNERMRASTVSRLESTITNLMNRASKTYKANSKQSNSEEIDPNYITRLSTNEFFFYTREPLTLEEFAKLQNKIAEEAKKHPSGVHLVLGSFAVKTDDDRVMNVVPYITCGEPPQFQFIVKSHTSLIDPRYNIPDGEGNTTLLKTLDKASHDPSTLLPSIEIDGVQHDFTFNNIVSCMTPGGTPFLTAVDICLDYSYGVAKNHLAQSTDIDIENIPFSQMVIANSVQLNQQHCLVKNPMHIDPGYSPIQCRRDTVQKTESSFELLGFSQDPASFYDLDKYPLSTLQEELASSKTVFISMLESLGLGIKVSKQSPLCLEFQKSQDILLLKQQLSNQQIPFEQTGPYTLEIADKVWARGNLIALGKKLIENQMTTLVTDLKTKIPVIDHTDFIKPDDFSLEAVQGVKLRFKNPDEANTFLAALQQVNPDFPVHAESVPQGTVLSCGVNLLTDKTFLNNVITTYHKTILATNLSAIPDVQLVSSSPFNMHFTSPTLYLSIKKYLDTNKIPYSEAKPLDLVIADTFFENNYPVTKMANSVNSPDKIHALTEMVQADVRELLTRLTIEHTKLQQEHDALKALEEQPPGKNALLERMHSTLESASNTIAALQNYQDDPESELPDPFLQAANQALTQTIPDIQAELMQVKQSIQQTKRQDVQELLTRLTTEHTKLQQQHDALEALKEPPAGTNTLVKIMHNTLRSAATTITALQHYLNNPESQSPAASLQEANRILTYIIPGIKSRLTQVQHTLLQKDLKNVDTYYKQNQLFSFFKDNYSKVAILNEFKDALTKINTVDELQTFENSLTDANHQNGAKYKILAQSQLVSFDETDSVKALNQMIQERKEVVSQANSLNSG